MSNNSCNNNNKANGKSVVSNNKNTEKRSSKTKPEQEIHQLDKPIIVLKIGSSSISGSNGQNINLNTISAFVELVCELVKTNYHVIVVTSGAVSVGCQRLNISDRPRNVITKQAVAAVGQGRLMRLYDDLFSILNQPIAQVLLSRENLSKQSHYINAMNTFNELLYLGIVPVVNENDTVAVNELKFGDNDTLSALIASLIRAKYLFLLTDVDALYTANPKEDINAKPIRVVDDIQKLAVNTGNETCNNSGKWGTGGMSTKIQAASIASAAGVTTAIVSTEHLNHIKLILNGSKDVGTQFLPAEKVIKGRKKWIAQGIKPAGQIVVDDGCAKSIINKKSLFAAGIVTCNGEFPANSAVSLVSKEGIELGRGITNYSSNEIEQIKGHHSTTYHTILPVAGPDTVIYRQNLVVLPSSKSYNKLTDESKLLQRVNSDSDSESNRSVSPVLDPEKVVELHAKLYEE